MSLLSRIFGSTPKPTTPRDRIAVAFKQAVKRFRHDPHFAHRVVRNDRTEYAWVVAERLAMHYAVNIERSALGLTLVDEKTIRNIEDTCCGHVDYETKYVLRCAALCEPAKGYLTLSNSPPKGLK